MLEQDTLIRTLAAQNTTRNAQFRLVLLTLALACTLPYLVALFRARTFVVALLGLTSLLSTAYLLYVLPPTRSGIPVLDAWAAAAGRDEDIHKGQQQRQQLPELPHRSPLEAYLPGLNAVLCVALAVQGWLSPASDDGWLVGLGSLPALVYGLVLVAKGVMASVDPERDLARLTYEYKGA